MLKPTLLAHANTQSADVIAYLLVDYTTCRMSLYSGLAVYNQVKNLTTAKSTPVLVQKKAAGHRKVGVLQNLNLRQMHAGFKVCTWFWGIRF